jgi:hypothetical protein
MLKLSVHQEVLRVMVLVFLLKCNDLGYKLNIDT